jgi:hypothetical protein
MGPTPISASHFHIRWSTKDLLDWQRFRTRHEAIEFASELVLPGETYAVEEHSSACPICQQYNMAATA